MRLRRLASVTAVLALAAVVGGSSASVSAQPPASTVAVRSAPPLQPSAVEIENSLPGTPVGARPDNANGVIEGYASEVSASPGDTLHFHVSTIPGGPYRVEVYRLGWYGGAGARLIGCSPSCVGSEPGQQFAAPTPDSNGLVRCNWPVTDTFALPPTAVSGYYRIRFVLMDGRFSSTYVVVKEATSATSSAILVQVPVNTWEAYNPWDGRSLYNQRGLAQQANRVSFDRPYSGTGIGWGYPLVLFLEQHGYDVSYQTDVDTDADPSSLLAHRLVIVSGHDEYWTATIRDAFDAARDGGVNLAFMGANDGYWQVRYEASRRVIVSYKSATADPVADPRLQTVEFRALSPPRYECQLIGIQHQGGEVNWLPSDYQVVPSALSSPWFAGTGFTATDTLRGLVSTETDTIPLWDDGATCGHQLTVFFHHEAGSDTLGNADASAYTAPSGATVFAAGSLQLSWGLADGSFMTQTGGGLVDPRLQQFVENMFDDLSSPHTADLGVTLQSEPADGDTVTVDATITNSGPDGVDEALVNFDTPPGMTFVRVRSTAFRCRRVPLQCTIPQFEAGDTARAVFTFEAQSRSTGTLSARAYPQIGADPDPKTARAAIELRARLKHRRRAPGGRAST